MRLLYNFASRSRPVKMIDCLENIINLSVRDDYSIILTLDEDDETVNTKEMRKKLEAFGEKVKPVYGISTGKVDAINKNVSVFADFDILCNHSDDMVFTKKGYDLDIREAFAGFDGLVHFPDGKQKDTCTYSMMTKTYLDIDGWIYNPEFISVYCDNYQQYVAKKRGKYKFVDKQILQHRHAVWGFGEKDELLKFTDSPEMYKRDKATFDRLIKTRAWE